MMITSKDKGIPQAFCFPRLLENVVSCMISLEPCMISLEPSLHSSFLKAAAFVMPLGGEAVIHPVGSAPRCIPMVAQESILGRTHVAFPRSFFTFRMGRTKNGAVQEVRKQCL